MKFEYTLNKSNCTKAICARYFFEHKIRTIIYTVVLLILAIIFAISALKAEDGNQWFLFAGCMIALAAIYYMPYSNARISAASFDRGSGVDGVSHQEDNRTDDLQRFAFGAEAFGQILGNGDGIVGHDGEAAQSGGDVQPA